MNRLFRLGGLGLAVLVLAGCGSSGSSVAVTGRLLENGQPVKISTQGLPPGDKGIRVGFMQQGGKAAGETYFADVTPEDGSFRVHGPKSKGIPAGKYKITVHRGATGNPDHYQEAFSEENSKLDIEIPAARSATVDIDLGTKTATVK